MPKMTCKKYRSSDRTHVTVQWTKAEREEWNADSRESAGRVERHIAQGDCRNAFAVLAHLEGLAAHGINTPAHNDARRMFVARCLVR